MIILRIFLCDDTIKNSFAHGVFISVFLSLGWYDTSDVHTNDSFRNALNVHMFNTNFSWKKKCTYCITLSRIRLRDGFLRVGLVRRAGENAAAKCAPSNGTRAREHSLSAPKCIWKFVLPPGENKSVHTSPNGKTLWSVYERDYTRMLYLSTTHVRIMRVLHMKTWYTDENSLENFKCISNNK